jgi:hypothetical protein
MSKYAEFPDLVERVTRLMKEENSVHYALGYMMQCYISLALRTNKLDTEIEHMQLIEKELQLKTKESA